MTLFGINLSKGFGADIHEILFADLRNCRSLSVCLRPCRHLVHAFADFLIVFCGKIIPADNAYFSMLLSFFRGTENFLECFTRLFSCIIGCEAEQKAPVSHI